MKLWAVGTGRCGMHNWTRWVKGFIDSDFKLRKLAVEYFQNPETNIDYAYEVFDKRSKMDVPGIADCCQFMFIDVIHKVDPDAVFCWLIRDREDCINDFMNKGAEEQRIHPKGWDFKYENKRALMEWYYDTVNKIIKEKVQGKNFRMIPTESMPRLVK